MHLFNTWHATQGKWFPEREIANHIGAENFDPFSNLIEVYIQRLRRKIDDGHELKLIRTLRGEGSTQETEAKPRQHKCTVDSVRTRLTFWYTGVLALALIIFCASISYLVEQAASTIGRRSANGH